MISPFVIFWILLACLILDIFPWTPKIIKRFVASWQGLAAGVIALGVYLWMPYYIALIDPTAGYYDAGILQWLGLSTVIYFFLIFLGWLGFQIAWRSLDKYDQEDLDSWFDEFTPRTKWCITQGMFVLMLFLYIICLVITPLS